MVLITSPSNNKIKQVRFLRHRKGREETGLCIVEGIRQVGEAIEAGVDIEALYYSPDLLESQFAHQLVESQTKAGIPGYACSVEVFRSITDRENPQGILALVRLPRRRLDELQPENFPWGVALVEPQDPGNVGSILRTIDAVGASGLILLDNSVETTHPTLVRASMGSMFWYPVVRASFAEFARWVQSGGFAVIGTSAHAELDYREVTDYPLPLILLMGSEREGLSTEQKAVCTRMVRLPMRGKGTSLNLAVATGILLYSLLDKIKPR
jgi:TrmH family RNA methyltransferase